MLEWSEGKICSMPRAVPNSRNRGGDSRSGLIEDEFSFQVRTRGRWPFWAPVLARVVEIPQRPDVDVHCGCLTWSNSNKRFGLTGAVGSYQLVGVVAQAYLDMQSGGLAEIAVVKPELGQSPTRRELPEAQLHLG